MRNSPLLRRQTPPAKTNRKRQMTRTPRPHIFQPREERDRRDYTTLFDLKRRPGYFNVDAKAALLRRTKEPPHDELFVDFTAREIEIGLSTSGAALLAGGWAWQATLNHDPFFSAGLWRTIRWQSTRFFDYLELELPLTTQSRSGGDGHTQARSASEGLTTESLAVGEQSWRLNRQMLLTREDRFILLADALIGPSPNREDEPSTEPAEIHYSGSLPLAEETCFGVATDTREGWLTFGNHPRATAIDPALPEWRSEFSRANLLAENERITVSEAAMGYNLYAPLWIDLDPRRVARPLTWRRLTVAENRATVPRDVATAYRIQAGRQQWLLYRSLSPAGNRSVLGYNTLQSFVVARIEANAAVKEIIAID